MTIRVLRLYRGDHGNDLPMIYLHTDNRGKSLCNGDPVSIVYSGPGPLPGGDGGAGLLHLVLSHVQGLTKGRFLASTGGGAILEVRDDSSLEVLFPGFIAVSERCQVWDPIRTAVLTVSDKGSRGEREDTAGPALAERVVRIGAVVEDREVVPDEVEAIRERILRWSSMGIELVLCTGGTGLSPRDVTPEALLGVADKVVPGFGELMRSRSGHGTPRAFLSRGLGVTVGKTLVLAFPGSRSGVLECFEAVEPCVRHGVEILTGKTSECGHHHHH